MSKWTLAIALSLAVTACKSGDKSNGNGTATNTPSSSALDANAELVLDELVALETKTDVTCWISFRQLDWFIAEKSYSEFGTLAKIAAIRRLVRAAWAKGAQAAGKGPITTANFESAVKLPKVALPDDQKAKLETFANDVGLTNYTDYQKTAEHWRVVLAVVQDEIYRGGANSLPAMDKDALRWLADASTVLSLELLKKSGQIAESNKHQMIEGEDVQAAYAEIAKAHGLENEPNKSSPLSVADVAKRLQPLTKKLIEGKIKALQSFNKTSDKITSDLNRVSRMKLSDDAVKLLSLDLQSFAHFVTAGFEPMRADNYLSDGSFAKGKLPRLAYLDEVHAQNVLEQLFPHEMLADGDVVVRFEPNPGPIVNKQRKPFEIKMLDHEMNGVRDSAIHWIVMRNVWNETPYAMDPFAAEYTSEVVSMMMTLYIRRGEQIARELGKDVIDLDVARRVRDKSYVMVPPKTAERAKWTDERKAHKDKLLASYPAALYRDVTARSGLPTKAYTGGQDLGAIDAHVDPKKTPVGGHGVEGHVDPEKPAVEGHVDPKKPAVEGHVDPKKPAVEGHGVEGHGVEGHVEPNIKQVGGHFSVQRIMGGGIGVGDVNRDGYADLYLTGEGMGRLYVNRGKAGAGRFTDATKAWGLPEDIGDGHGVLFFDLEGDGDQDLLVVRSETASNLFRNDGKKFVDVSKELGFRTHNGAHVATIFDYDEDGDLDIYIGYYGNHDSNVGNSRQRSLPSLDGRNGSPNQLWRNDGAKLVEVGEKAGVADVGWTLALSTFDHDMDGHLDIYLANDFGANALYRNRGDGTFENLTDATHTGDRGSGMNVDFTDFNGDGRWDIYVTNIDMFSKRIKVVFPRDESTISIDESLVRAFQYLSGNKFYVSAPGKTPPYSAVEGAKFEPGDRGWGWDASFFDYENDGDDDLYLTNGWIDGSYAGSQKNQLFLNDDQFFYLAPSGSAEAFPGNTRSAAAVDLDNDGDVDLVTNQFRQAPRVLENVQKTKNHWIQLNVRGSKNNPDAIGALIQIEAGDKKILRQVTCGRGYLSQADPVVTAGLGPATSAKVTVTWPGGAKNSFDLAADKRHTIEP